MHLGIPGLPRIGGRHSRRTVSSRWTKRDMSRKKEMSSSFSRMKGEEKMGTWRLTTGSSGCRISSSRDSGRGRAIGKHGRPMSFIVVVISLFGTVWSLPSVAGETMVSVPVAMDGFHPPATVAERALDATLKASDADSGLFLFVVNRPDRQVTDDEKFSGFFTRQLLDVIAAVEKSEVERDCGGRYTDEICGLDFNPITCAQDEPEKGYAYRTEKSSARRQVIAMSWSGRNELVATYRMVKQGGAWKMDGVACHPSPRFNMRSLD